ncbi:MAG: hypothetical protein ACJ8FS_06400 [Sphingomicrobium sp.]
MAVYVVTWDLNKEEPNYASARAAFIRQLETYENTRDPGLDSVRFISTASGPNDIDGYLRQQLDTNDRLFVSKLISGQHQGWLNEDVWTWINARL